MNEQIIEIDEAGNNLEDWLSSALNRFSAENASDTPDFILAQFLLGCLTAWNQGVQRREEWYGRGASASTVSGPVPSVDAVAKASK